MGGSAANFRDPTKQQGMPGGPAPDAYGRPTTGNYYVNRDQNGNMSRGDQPGNSNSWASPGQFGPYPNTTAGYTQTPIDYGFMNGPQGAGMVGQFNPQSAQSGQAMSAPTDPSMSDFAYGGRSQNQWDLVADEYKKRQALQGDFGLADNSRVMMNDAAQRYLAMANGTGPSLAQLQLQQGTDRGIAAQMAMANSQRGGGLAQAAAMRGAQLGGQQMQTGLANQAAQLRNQEQMQGIAGYGAMSGQMRGQDLAQAQANLNASLQSRGMNDAMVNGIYGHGMQAAQLEQVGRMGYAGLKGQMAIQKYIADQNARLGLATNATAQRGQDFTAVGAGVGATLGFVGGAMALPFLGGSNRDNGNTTDPSATTSNETGASFNNGIRDNNVSINRPYQP